MTWRNPFPPTLSQSTSTIGKGEPELQVNLIQLGVTAHFPPVSYIETNTRNGDGDLIWLRPDALIKYDPLIKDGVIEVQGGIHRMDGQKEWDRKKREMYESMGLWLEELLPKDAKKLEKVREAVGRHRR